MDFTHFWLSSSFTPFLPLQRYILGLLWFSLSLLPILLLSSAKNKPTLEATFQGSLCKTKSCVESEKCTYGIVYIFTSMFQIFYWDQVLLCSLLYMFYPCNSEEKKPNPILFLFSLKPSRQGFCTTDTFLIFDLHTAHMHYITRISEVILSLHIDSWQFNSVKANLDCFANQANLKVILLHYLESKKYMTAGLSIR